MLSSDGKLGHYQTPSLSPGSESWAIATSRTVISNCWQQSLPARSNCDHGHHGSIALPHDSFLNQLHGRGDDVINSLCKKLAPLEKFNRRCQEMIDLITDFTHQCSSISISGLMLGGSVGQRTCLNYKSDLDIILFARGLQSMDEFLQAHEALKTQLSFELTRWKNNKKYLRIIKITTLAVTIQLRRSLFDDFMDVDLVLAFDNLSHHESLWSLFAEMNRQSTSLVRYKYSSSLVPLQLMFITSRLKCSSMLADLIRLVKYWRKSHFKQIEKEHKLSLPTSYVFELLVIHLWEKAGSPTNFSLKTALKTVLISLAHSRDIYASWTDFYQPTMFPNKANKTMNKPFVLDPVNPFNNVCEFYSVEAWDVISEMAIASCNSRLLIDVEPHYCVHQWR